MTGDSSSSNRSSTSSTSSIYQLANWVEFYNGDSTTVPAFGVMRCTGNNTINGRFYLFCKQPNTFADFGTCFINGPVPVAAGSRGQCTRAGLFAGLYDPATGTPAAGQTWGPISGSWYLSQRSFGFMAYGPATDVNDLAFFGPVTTSFIIAQVSTAKLAPQTNLSMTAFYGTLGGESTTGQTVSAYLRRGVIFGLKSYQLGVIDGQLEVINPTKAGPGKAPGAIAKGGSGNITIYQEGPIGNQGSSGISTTGYSRFTAIGAGNQIRWEWNDDSQAIEITAEECSS